MRSLWRKGVGEKKVRILIAGRVQGVCFRAYTCEEGQKLKLKGTVRNLPDGRVEVLAQGTMKQIQKLEAFCWKGPPFAHVLNVESFEEEIRPGEDLSDFRITY